MLGRGLVFVIPEALGDTVALVGKLCPYNALEGAGEGPWERHVLAALVSRCVWKAESGCSALLSSCL